MKILKYTCFHVIPYIHSPLMCFFPHISMATMTTFPCTSLIVKKTNWVEQARKICLGAMPSPNIAGLAFLLNKTFPPPTAE